ncbi:MAG TPA: SURF1 family protein [Noviherbaspirillum sp.]|nr:SURF1 family protein [Noviherbaspirillum sp.]
MPMKFRFRWIPFVAAVLAALVGISLGQWQTRRAIEKELIEKKLIARELAPPLRLQSGNQVADEMEYRQVSVKGEFVGRWTVYLDNRPYKSTPGFYVMAPLKLSGSDMHVLIARGWAKRDVADRTKVPPVVVPDGTVEIQGVVRRSPGHVLQLGAAEQLRPGAIVQNLDIAEFAQAAKMPMQDFIIEQINDGRDGLVRDWPRPSTGAEKHRAYAFQWYALAATALIFFVVTGFRRGTK